MNAYDERVKKGYDLLIRHGYTHKDIRDALDSSDFNLADPHRCLLFKLGNVTGNHVFTSMLAYLGVKEATEHLYGFDVSNEEADEMKESYAFGALTDAWNRLVSE